MTSAKPDRLPERVVRKTLFPANMAKSERKQFARELYAVHSRIFSGVSLKDFTSHVVEPQAELTAIQVFFDQSGQLVGYCAFHRFTRELERRRVVVLRAEAGLLPQYRGRAFAHWFGMLGALREKLRHPFARVFYFGTLVHPSSYRFFCKYFPTVFPRRDNERSVAMRELAIALADSFEASPVDAHTPLVRDVGWVTRETLEHPALISEQGQADVHYFETTNPGYVEGHGLVVLVPVTFSNVGYAILKRFSEIILGMARRRHFPL